VKITWREHALRDYQSWQSIDPHIFETINKLIRDIRQGRVKPKVLQRELKGWLSLQITKEKHRWSTAFAERDAASRSWKSCSAVGTIEGAVAGVSFP
jgi:Txe/YoeB family toxin of Txe-Axe toxin-antitoxin module